MEPHYNRIAGQSVERLAALSDGVFAVAMTLMVLDLRAPAAEAVHGDAALLHALRDLLPDLVIYMMSFMTLGIFWVGQQTQLNHLRTAERDLAWIHLAFLFAVTLMPFATAVMARFTEYRPALLVYWANMVLLGGLLYAAWSLAVRRGLVREDAPAALLDGVRARIQVAQALYAVGAALCVVSTYLSIAVIILVQLNYVLAPRVGRWLR